MEDEAFHMSRSRLLSTASAVKLSFLIAVSGGGGRLKLDDFVS